MQSSGSECGQTHCACAMRRARSATYSTACFAPLRCAALPDGGLPAAPGHTGWLVQVCDSRDCRYAELVREARAEQQAAVAEARRTEAELRTLQVL